MPDLPAHIERLIEAQVYLDEECGDVHTPSAAKLRAILEAAQNMAEATAYYRTDSGECGFCGNDPSDDPDFGCDRDCPHRKLKEAMNNA